MTTHPQAEKTNPFDTVTLQCPYCGAGNEFESDIIVKRCWGRDCDNLIFRASHSGAGSAAGAVLDDRMIAWIREGDRGISSEVIFEVLANHPLLETELDFSTPEDASDFNRCHELILRIPEWENRLNEVSEKHRHWKLIIERWQELKTCLINDIADDGRSCNRLLNELNKYRYAPEKYEELRSKTKDRGDR